MVKVLITSDSRYPVNRKVIKSAVNAVFKAENIESLDAEVSVLVCGSRKMKDLTSKYLGDELDHEVLSFPLEETKVDKHVSFSRNSGDVLRLGDVVVCWPKVLELAARDDMLVDDKLAFLVSHGVEHLLGKHHEDTN